MEGLPVRRPDRIRSTGLNEAGDTQIFQAELVNLLAAELPDVEIFFGLIDNSKGSPLPPWVRSHLDRHPSLYQKLQMGELVGSSHKQTNPAPQPVGSRRSNILLIPVIHQSVLYGAIGLISRPDGPHVFALRLNKAGGSIHVEFLHGRDRETTVKISQNGEAIPSEMPASMFAHSANAIPGRMPQSQNTGEFDLSGIYDVIGMHGGRIFVNSKAGEGSTVLFTLPAVMPDGEENFDHEQAVHTSRRRR